MKTMKKTVSILLILTMLFSTFAIMSYATDGENENVVIVIISSFWLQ